MKQLRWFLLPFVMVGIGCNRFSESARQPIVYNHKKHIEAGLGCLDCHIRAAGYEKASIPNIDICEGCHRDPLTNSREEAILRGYIDRKERIPWVQIHKVPDVALFSHRRHSTLGKLNCEECHGNVAVMQIPFSKPFQKIEMGFCIKCHEKRAVTTDCASCHR